MPSSPRSPSVVVSSEMSSTGVPSPDPSRTRTVPARSAIHRVSPGPAAPAVGDVAFATWVRAAAARGPVADSSADADVRAREVTRQSVAMIAELLVRTFTVASWRRRMGGVTLLPERGSVGCAGRQATRVGGRCVTGYG